MLQVNKTFVTLTLLLFVSLLVIFLTSSTSLAPSQKQVGIEVPQNQPAKPPAQRPPSKPSPQEVELTGEIRFSNLEGGCWYLLVDAEQPSEDAVKFELKGVNSELLEQYRNQKVKITGRILQGVASICQLGPILEISTLEPLIKSSSTIDTSDWQIYRNEEYGFEVRYPAQFTVIEDRPYEDYISIVSDEHLQTETECITAQQRLVEQGVSFGPGPCRFGIQISKTSSQFIDDNYKRVNYDLKNGLQTFRLIDEVGYLRPLFEFAIPNQYTGTGYIYITLDTIIQPGQDVAQMENSKDSLLMQQILSTFRFLE